MIPRILKNERDYSNALARIEELFNAAPNTDEGDELELLTMLVERYEAEAFPIDLPTPLAAIRFRMDQQSLKAKDLVPYIGSASKVSEVLSGQRSLSLTMIRNLVEGLGIPAEVLLRKPGACLDSDFSSPEAAKFPIAEMVRRGWFAGFRGTAQEARTQLEDLFADFIGALGRGTLQPTLNRQHIRAGKKMNAYALTAWRIRVATMAMRVELPAFVPGTISSEFLRDVVRLSYLDEGPRLAKEFLNKNGIHFVTERHLSGTYLDGAALRLPNGAPVVAVTLRHDRLDNFWFTLAHELAHVALHLNTDDIDAFYDDLDEQKTDALEQEADGFASEALVPSTEWKNAGLSKSFSREKVKEFAERLRITPAIPAGRIRFERRDYSLLTDLVGNKCVRCLFQSAGQQ